MMILAAAWTPACWVALCFACFCFGFAAGAAIVERLREENAALRARLLRSAPENAVSLPPVDEL